MGDAKGRQVVANKSFDPAGGCQIVADEGFDPVAYINEPRWRDSSYGLHRIRALLERLGRPQDRLRFVHVAGTNGKGSTCAYLASVLAAAGYRTGMFTSPYLFRFEERIQVDGECIPWDDLTRVTLDVRDAAEGLAATSGEHATEFELMTAVALVYFERQECDIVVLEVGLGGTLDSTNVIDAPEVCVITRIGLDHTALLGGTLAEIARQKAGIIKPGSAVVKQDDVTEVMDVVRAAAAAQGCDVVVARAELGAVEWPRDAAGGGGSARLAGGCDTGVSGVARGFATRPSAAGQSDGTAQPGASVRQSVPLRHFTYGGREYVTRLLGSYQPQNAATALAAVDALRARGWAIAPDAVARGIAETRWPARFEVVATSPTVVVDGGHNPQGAEVLAETLRDVFPGQKFVFIMSVLADKDYRAMIRSVLPLAQAFVTLTPPNPRALDAQGLASEIQAACCAACTNVHDGRDITQCNAVPARAVPDAAKALHVARVLAGASGVVVAFGSLYSVAQIIEAL